MIGKECYDAFIKIPRRLYGRLSCILLAIRAYRLVCSGQQITAGAGLDGKRGQMREDEQNGQETKAGTDKAGRREVAADFMQLSVCGNGVWNDDAGSGLCVVLVACGQSHCVHRSVSVCADYLLFRGRVACDSHADGAFDEQPPGLLQSDVSGGFPADGEAQAVYDPYDDR